MEEDEDPINIKTRDEEVEEEDVEAEQDKNELDEEFEKNNGLDTI